MSALTEQVNIELTKSQVSRVLQSVREKRLLDLSSSWSADAVWDTLVGRVYLARPNNFRTMSRSLVLGLLVLHCLPPDGSPRSLEQIAAPLKLSRSTTHRYASTLVAAGLVERDSDGYRLAALARERQTMKAA